MESEFYTNIDTITRDNVAFRRVLSTTYNTQLVVMSIETDIGEEVHPTTTQFVKVEGGEGVAIIDGIKYFLKEGDCIMISPNKRHNIINTGNTPLKLYSLYSPPEHRHNQVDYYRPTNH